MASHKMLLCAAVLISCSLVSGAQNPTIKKVPAPYTPITSGHEMYVAYCGSCHGADGKGNGPAAPALKVAPSDLTTLAKRSGGKFPFDRTFETIRGEANLPAHGSKDMPVWGPVFRAIDSGHEAEVRLRLSNLTKYIESLQAK